MMGRTTITMNWTTLLMMMLIFIAATLAQGVAEDFFEEITTKFGPLEVTQGELESNRLHRKELELEKLERSQDASASAAESTGTRFQDQGAFAAILGTRRRGSHKANETLLSSNRRGCVTEGAVFAEGSAMVSPDECSYCFCIRGRQRCVAPKCLLPVEGCRPRYRSFSCCPAYYDCHDSSTTTTTTTRTPRDCEVNGIRYAEGTLVEDAGGECENCYCLNGEVTCSQTTCAPPLDGCKPVMQEGLCCPVKYDCDDGNRRVSVDQFLKDFPFKVTTADQRREFERMKPEWQTNMARQSPGGEVIIADPKEGQVFEFGHPGEAILVQDINELTTPQPVPNSTVKIGEQIEVGAGVNVKGNLEDAIQFGPILIYDNRVRTDRQHKKKNVTEVEGEGTPQDGEESTAVTDIPEETTIFAREDIANDDKIIVDDTITEGDLSTDYDAGTEEVTTLLPTQATFQETTVKSLSELLSSAMEALAANTTETHLNVPSPSLDDLVYPTGNEPEYSDIETDFPSYDITVGTSVLANSHGPPQSTGIGEVIPVELEPEHKTPQTEIAPEIEERPSLLGTILDILTRPERPESPKPGRLPPPPPPPPPFRSPFRPRPRPDVRPNTRPDFVPPRFRFTPPPPPPSPVANDRETTEDTDANFLTSAPAQLPTSTPEPTIFEAPPEPPVNIINSPASGTSRPKPVINSPIHSAFQPDLPIRPDFLPKRPPVVVNRPIAPLLPEIPEGLPSKPVIEGGFQGMRDEEGIQPNIDYDYDIDGEPTLPPSLPNLKIIPFVAADALVNQEIGIAGDEFKAPPLLLTEIGDENPDNQRPDETTENPTTTTRRPFPGRRPILPPRRPIVRPGDEPTSRRPPLRRTSRPPFTSKTTAPATIVEDAPEDEEELAVDRPSIPFKNREHPSTRPPFIPPRRPTPTTEENTSTATTSTTTTTTITQSIPPVATTPKPIVSDDIANLLLQDVFGLSKPQNTPPVRFTQTRTTPKPIIQFKISTALPEIPSAVRDQLPLATDPVLASGLLKLSGCNIYGRMYDVGDQIKELSAPCKECRCTPVGVQCLPVC